MRRLVLLMLGFSIVACSGGSSPNGAGGATSTGGRSGTGGGNATGGAGTGGAVGAGGQSSTCSGALASEVTRVSGWLTNTKSGLPDYAYTNIKKNFPTTADFDKLVCSIVMSCTEFAPKEANWQLYCEAVISSAIVSESSYDPKAFVLDSYGKRIVNNTTANDPTVGLLQDRFSSTVHDYNYFGVMSKMAAIGCNWPAALNTQADDAVFWATQGGTTYLGLLQDPACNIALATYYYFINATGNGGATPIYAYQYCQGQGIAGNMVIGLLSHLEGPGFPRPPDANNAYVTGIKSRFVPLIGGTLPSPDPFTESLAPEKTKYCR